MLIYIYIYIYIYIKSQLVSVTHCTGHTWAAFHLAVNPSKHLLDVTLWQLVCMEYALDYCTILYLPLGIMGNSVKIGCALLLMCIMLYSTIWRIRFVPLDFSPYSGL